MKRIWKYTFDTNQTNRTWDIPRGALILHVREQHGFPCIWMLVETDCETEQRTFAMTGTGTHIEFDTSKAVYLGTAFMHNGMFVFHIFEVIN